MYELVRAVIPVLTIVYAVVAVRDIEDDRFHKTEYEVVGYAGRTKEVRRAERSSRRAVARYKRDCRREERALLEDSYGDNE